MSRSSFCTFYMAWKIADLQAQLTMRRGCGQCELVDQRHLLYKSIDMQIGLFLNTCRGVGGARPKTTATMFHTALSHVIELLHQLSCLNLLATTISNVA